MRKWLALACFLALPAAAAVQDAPIETVTSNASALVGVWRIAWPQWGRASGAWGPMSDRFCRIERAESDLAIRCFTDFQMGNGIGTVKLDGAMIHFAWGSFLVRNVFDGTLQSPTRIAGKMGVKFSGALLENPATSAGEKFSLSQAAADKPDRAVLLRTALEQLAQGALILPHDAAIGSSQSDGVAALGAIQSVTYLGQEARALGTPAVELDFFSVYAVEFAGGERLCGLHQRDDGMLDAFRCV